MKYSMMSYTVARQKDHFDLKKMLKLTAEIMDGIDFVTLYGEKAEDLRKMTDDLGIPVVCHTFLPAGLPSLDPVERQAGIDACKRGIEAAVTLGAPVIMLPTPGGTIPRDELRRNWISGLKEVIGFAKKANIVMTIENFPGIESPFVIADDVLEAIDAVPGLELTFDSGNAASGENPVESFKRCARHVVHAHFKDFYIVDVKTEGWRPMLDGRYYRSALIGEGKVDNAGCLKAMKEAGYSGYINIEYEANKYDPYEGTRRAVEYLRRVECGA